MPYTIEEWKEEYPNDLEKGQVIRVHWQEDHGDPDVTYFKYFGKDIDEMDELLDMSGVEDITMNDVWELLIQRHHEVYDDEYKNAVKYYELEDCVDCDIHYEKGGCGDEHNFSWE